MEPIRVDLEEATKTFGFIAGLVTAIYTIWKKVIKPMFTQIQILRGMVATLEQISEYLPKIDAITKEVLPNGGSSLRDAINRIESRQMMHESRLQAFVLDSPAGTWESNEHGHFIAWNNTLEKMIGREPRGMNWIHGICAQDRDEVLKQWADAVKYKNEFFMEFTFQNPNGAKFKCKVKAYPLVNQLKEVKGWFGVATKIND